jgi:hypothetical protein
VPYTVVAVPDSFAQLDTEMTTLAGDVPAWQNDGIAVSQADPDPTGTISLSLATPTAAQLSALSRLGWLGRHLADDLLMDQSHQVDPTRSRGPAIGCLPVDLGQKILDEPGMPDDTALQLGAQSLGVGESRANGIANSVEPVEVEGKVLVQIQSVAIRSFVYGGRDLRQSIRERGTGYVLAVRSNYMVILPSGRRVTVKNAAGLVKPGMWQRMRTGSATNGARDYHWAMIEITPGDTPEGHDDGHAFLLLRRHRYTGTVSYFLCWSPAPVPLAKLICVAVASWGIEEDHQQSKQVSGLDSGQVTTWTSRHRWTAVSLLAHAFLAAAAACQRALDGSAGILGLLPVTVPELLRQLRGTAIPDPRRDKAHRDA